MRSFSYITVGKILRELKEEGTNISRITFYKVEKSLNLDFHRTEKGWRTFTRKEADEIKDRIKSNYNIDR